MLIAVVRPGVLLLILLFWKTSGLLVYRRITQNQNKYCWRFLSFGGGLCVVVSFTHAGACACGCACACACACAFGVAYLCQALPKLRTMFSPKNRYQMTQSRYSGEISTRVAPLRDPRVFTAVTPQDTDALDEKEREIKQHLIDLQEQVTQCRQQEGPLRKQKEECRYVAHVSGLYGAV